MVRFAYGRSCCGKEKNQHDDSDQTNRALSQLLTFREVCVRMSTCCQSVQTLRVERLHTRVVAHLTHLVKVLQPVVVKSG